MNPQQPENTHLKLKKKCSNLMPICVFIVVIAEIMFLGRLDILNNKSLVNSWADSFVQFTTLPWSSRNYSTFDDDDDDEGVGSGRVSRLEESSGSGECEKWLEKHDFIAYSRDFVKQPVYVAGVIEVWSLSLSVHVCFGIFTFCWSLVISSINIAMKLN